MSETNQIGPNQIGLSEAARHLGVPVRVLRRAIRAGTVAAPAKLTATTPLSAEWLASTKDAVEASPHALSRMFAQKAPAFARYKGTSAWVKYPRRAREYTRFRTASF